MCWCADSRPWPSAADPELNSLGSTTALGEARPPAAATSGGMGPPTADPTVWWRIKTGQYVRCEAGVLPSAWQHFHVFTNMFVQEPTRCCSTVRWMRPAQMRWGQVWLVVCHLVTLGVALAVCFSVCVRTGWNAARSGQLERSQTPKCVHLGSLHGAPRLPSVRSNVKGSARHSTGQITPGFQLLVVTQLQLGSHACW